MLFSRTTPLPQIGLWTFEPTILFSHSSAVSHLVMYIVTTPSLRVYPLFIFNPLVPYQNHIWTIYGSPLFPKLDFGLLSPPSFFHTRQRFPISNHVTSGWMSPRSSFDHWSAVSHTGSSSGHVIALGQSGARKSAIRAHFTTDLCSQS